MIESLILILLTLQSCAINLIPSDIKVTITSLTQCQGSQGYPVAVQNVMVNLDNGKIAVTGTLSSSVNLTPPIKAILKVEKDELRAWIEIPCINGIGSCTYDDLCIHSIPRNGTCPESFINNKVPCRCPIPKGTYTIPSMLEFEVSQQNDFSFYNGKYWVRALVNHKDMQLACYEVYFEIGDKLISGKRDELDTFLHNYLDRPFITLL